MKTNQMYRIYVANDKENGYLQIEAIDTVTTEVIKVHCYKIRYATSDVNTTLQLIQLGISKFRKVLDRALIMHSCGNLEPTLKAAKGGRGKFADVYSETTAAISKQGTPTHIRMTPLEKSENPAWINREKAELVEKTNTLFVDV